MFDHSFQLIVGLASDPCTCQYNLGSLTMSWDQETGEHQSYGDRGPRTFHCLRCRAQEALAADGYVPDVAHNTYRRYDNVDPDTCCKTFDGQVFTSTGSFYPRV